MRAMIQQRTFFPVYGVGAYTSYDNQDFGTTKGFSFTYDLRRTNNVQINANYTLAFADGTGSDANSQRGLTNRGNIRTLFPLNFDERHRLNLVLDYRFPGNAPSKILQQLGANLQAVAVSGRPFTATFVPQEFDGTGTRGAINGARKPWNYTLNLRVDKQFEISKGLGVNLYVRVSNLLDRRNTIEVYSVTGSPEDPGFLQSAFGDAIFNNFRGGVRPLEGYLNSYSWRVLNPDFFSLPRRVFAGIITNF
ncbi:MAG: hypothetical protein HC821_00615 [Lewinella sp.]|nr:hypothetical protein [Lewinella sp.]